MKEPENNAIQLFEDQKIRVAWDVEREEWYFSIVDVVGVLTDSPDYNTGRKYWNKLKQCPKEEGSELVTNCHQLKMRHGCRTGQSTQRRPQIGNESKLSYREILGNCRPRTAYISDFDREMAKYLKGGEPRIDRTLSTLAELCPYVPWMIEQDQKNISIENQKAIIEDYVTDPLSRQHADVF